MCQRRCVGPSGIVVGFAGFDFRKITKYGNLVNVGLLSDRRPDETSEADFRPTAWPFRLVLATHKCQPTVSVVSRILGKAPRGPLDARDVGRLVDTAQNCEGTTPRNVTRRHEARGCASHPPAPRGCR